MTSDAAFKSNLAKDYGFDINMNDSDLITSSAASKSYQKRCSFIYSEFVENMKTYLRQENELKQCLQQLQKEKIQNMKFSLYRSSGDDLFSTSKKRRQKMIENLTIVSPLLFDDNRVNTPWGLDPIIDVDEEQMLRPHTAPSSKIKDSAFDNITETKIYKGTEQNHNIKQTDKPKPSPIIITLPNENKPDKYDSPVKKTLDIPPNKNLVRDKNSAKTHNEHVHFFIEPPTPAPKTDTSRNIETNIQKEDKTILQNYSENVDGEVDLHTQHTRARKITIKPEVFAKLSSGSIQAKLSPKEGKFLIKPVVINYTPSDVDAVFLAKDPTKEKMALVRQMTTCLSGTVSADLKINNRIAIMKSLIGKDAKKTSVAEIFDKANDRKTKHFRIIKKGAVTDTNSSARRISTVAKMAKAVHKLKSFAAMKRNSQAFEHEATSPVNRPPSTPLPPRRPLMSLSSIVGMTRIPATNRYDDGLEVNMMQITHGNGDDLRTKTKCSEKNDTDIRPRTSSVGVRPFLTVDNSNRTHSQQSFHRLNDHDLGDSFKSLDGINTPVENKDGSLSRNGGSTHLQNKIFQGTDVDVTQMIRDLVEGKTNDVQVVFPPHERPCSNLSMASRTSHMKRMNIPRRGTTPSNQSDNMSDTSFGFERPPSRSINKRDTIEIVKMQMKQDKEYQENISKMKSRLSGGKKILKRRASIRV